MFLTFFKIGAFTFGGGFAMIPIIQREVVEKKNWIKDEEFIDTISIAQSAPGPVAVNSSIFVGYKIDGLKGAIICTVGTVLPSFFIILFIAVFFTQFKNNPLFEEIFLGIRPVVVALIFSAVYKLITKAHLGYKDLVIAIIAMLTIVIFNVTPIYVIVVGVALRVIYNKFKNKE
ncbi:chromate transporter [Tissierella creatinophila]|uniref:Putative chromate transport protein n=1 Tax=Tissierella creatinophila DSM 6911 TaxID=1123403 RepID=A0A1U7M3G0_TISCR|nr:chromate transporter [Tissierella creatinophila]OLS01815.1 putative chromate transport protein [Tissierella creatinophila DSM 6911]